MLSIDDFALELTEARIDGLSHDGLAEKLSLSVGYIKKREKELLKEVGKRRLPSGKLAKALGLSYTTLFLFMEAYGLMSVAKNRAPERDELIAEGLSSGEIVSALKGHYKISRQGVMQYIHVTGQFEFHCERKSQRSRKFCFASEKIKKAAREFCAELNHFILHKPEFEELDRATELAIGYHLSKQYKPTNTPLKKIIFLLKTYFTAQELGIKVSTNCMSELCGIKLPEVGRMLGELGLEPMYRPPAKTKKRTPVSKETKQAIEQAGELKITYVDLAYFLGIGSGVVSYHLSGKRPVGWSPYKLEHGLSFRVASQIYESIYHAGFTEKEASELLDVSVKAIRYAQTNKEGIEKIIVNVLDTLFPGENHTNPYLTRN